ncbi:Transcription initiation factor TFIID subunit 8 [Cytospora mali]|uniref:Transcription initiation factor TFIID subunit 8 n=1 Tax=Cytospora mali TaxID=578113 RepID=A0A194W894_CYTMA|nr:Transcription initiation factor TFIID subunit 8 [Valsa mali]
MGPESPRKRASSSTPTDDNSQPAKRQRTASASTAPSTVASIESDLATRKDGPPNYNEQHRMQLRRAITLALDHVGFDSASEEALESFTHMTETYLSSLAEDVKVIANSARRTQPIPTDFDTSFKRYNLDYNNLKKHRKPPIPQQRIKATYTTEMFLDGETMDLPTLDDELSGKTDKDAKPYIPGSFPDFPSIHTYRYTPTDVESVTVLASNVDIDGSSKRSTPDWRGDPKKIREAAATQAKQAEEALRRLVRASKQASLKDMRSTAEKNPVSKVRYNQWEEAMKELLQEQGRAGGRDDAVREEVADHSMVVNAQKKYHRREIPRTAKRMGDAIKGKG